MSAFACGRCEECDGGRGSDFCLWPRGSDFCLWPRGTTPVVRCGCGRVLVDLGAERVKALEAALRRIVPVLDRCISDARAGVPPGYAETVDALDDVRAALEGS